MIKIKITGIIILLHGIIEIMGPIGSIAASVAGSVDIGEYMYFIVPFFQNNVMLVTLASFIYGALRLIGAIGLFKNRKWGMDLSITLSVITLTLMMFILPAGIMDGVLSGIVLVLLLVVRNEDAKIIE